LHVQEFDSEKKFCLASQVLGVLALALLCTALVGTSAFAAGNHGPPEFDRMIARWAKHNGCSEQPSVEDRRSDEEAHGHTATRFVFRNCRDNADVALWKLTRRGSCVAGRKTECPRAHSRAVH
jgi:poly(3-hydroxybutyrate) depolymerase